MNLELELDDIYDELGFDLIKPDLSVITAIQDNKHNLNSSTLYVVRVLSGHGLNEGDIVTFRGNQYKVMKIYDRLDIGVEFEVTLKVHNG